MMTEIMIAIIGSGIITKLLDVLIDVVKRRKNPMVAGIKYCLLNDLTNYGEKLLTHDTITSTDLKKFEEMYKTYKALGGDGFADKLYKEVIALPLKVVA